MHTNVKRYINYYYVCAIAVPRHDPPPITNRPLPSRPWETVALDFKGPIGGNNGFYFHIAIDTYRISRDNHGAGYQVLHLKKGVRGDLEQIWMPNYLAT